jgi:hypothetical protein
MRSLLMTISITVTSLPTEELRAPRATLRRLPAYLRMPDSILRREDHRDP